MTIQDKKICKDTHSILKELIEVACNKKPHCCPVCGGRGEVSGLFYQTDNSTSISINAVTCKTCGGAGVVWG